MPDSDIALRPARSLDPQQLVEFARAVWPDKPAEQILSRWWVASDFADTLVAVDPDSRIGALCVGVPSQWSLPGGELAEAVSICGWYVHPKFAGRGLGQMLVRAFEERAPFLNTLSISQAAVRSFEKLGWVGPRRTRLRLLPLPATRRQRGQDRVAVQSFSASAGDLPEQLGQALDLIDAERPADQLRRVRTAQDWRARLRAKPRRRYRFHLVLADRHPIGYFAVRSTDDEAGLQFRLARLHYVTDAVFNRDEPEVQRAAFAALARAAPTMAGALLLCTSSETIAAAASDAGWLDEHSPMLGSKLAAKAPQYMLGGRFVPWAGADIRLTFADSDVDLNI